MSLNPVPATEHPGPFTITNPNQLVVISPDLQRDVSHDPEWHLQPARILDVEMLTNIIEETFGAIGTLGHGYHSPSRSMRVVSCVDRFLWESALSPEQAMLLKLAAAFQDYGHSGSTHRQLKEGVDRNDLSNEEYAALCADKALKDLLSPRQRLELQGLILATSVGKNHLDKLPPGQEQNLYRAYRPVSKLEKLLALADVSSCREGFECFLNDNIALLTECDVDKLPENFEQFLGRTTGFLAFVTTKVNDAAPFLDPDVVDGYHSSIREIAERLEALRSPGGDQGYRALFATVIEARKGKSG